MPQYKKDGIQERIDKAALEVFADKGYEAAKISDIAEAAGVSVGNIYRYYGNKTEIFEAAVPEGFPDLLRRLIYEKISAARDKGAGGAALRDVTESFIGFMLTNRERIKIIFSGSKGTRHEEARDECVASLLAAVEGLFPDKVEAYAARYGNTEILRLLYENLIAAYSRVLGLSGGGGETERALRQLNQYHYAGITSLLGL